MRLKLLLLISLFCTNLGEWVYFIALNLKVLDIAESAFAVSILYLLIPFAMLLTNSWAGSYIDRVNIKILMVFFSLIKALLVFCLVFSTNLLWIYSISFILHIMTAIDTTASFVYMTRLIPDKEQPRFNAWKSMCQSVGFILGPSIAGVLFIAGTIESAIIVNGILLFVSSLLFLLLPTVPSLNNTEAITLKVLYKDWATIIRFAKNNLLIASILSINALYVVCISSIDSLEAAFSITILHLNESSYGLLVSVAGFGFIIGSVVNIKWIIAPLTAFQWGLLLSAIGYFIYSCAISWGIAALGLFIASGALPFVNIGYTTYVQQQVSIGLLGRCMSIFGMIEAMGVIVLTSMYGFLSYALPLRSLIICGVVILFLVFCGFVLLEKHFKREGYKKTRLLS